MILRLIFQVAYKGPIILQCNWLLSNFEGNLYCNIFQCTMYWYFSLVIVLYCIVLYCGVVTFPGRAYSYSLWVNCRDWQAQGNQKGHIEVSSSSTYINVFTIQGLFILLHSDRYVIIWMWHVIFMPVRFRHLNNKVI